jgi:hypothetical protein
VTRAQESAPDDTAVLEPVPAGDIVREDDGERHDGLAAELAKAAPRRWWNRGTLVLGACALLLGGFLGGVQVQKHWGTTATANRTPAFTGQSRGTGTGGYPGFAGGGGPGATPTASAAAAATTGTVKLVDGRTIYVQTPDGRVVTVRTNGKTTVRAATTSAIKDIKAGQTVTVEGGADADGTVTATSVTATKK